MSRIMPWNKRESENPLVSLRSRMDNLFDEFFQGFPGMSLSKETSEFLPRIDVSETEKELHVNAELPGMSEKDIEVTLENNALTLKGEKKHEQEHKDKHYHHIERRYGSFYRSIPISDQVDTEKIEASFKNGVLNVVIPKKESAKKSSKINIKTS